MDAVGQVGDRADGHRAYTDPNKPSLDRPKITTGTASGFANAATSSSHPTISHLYIMGVAFEADSRNYRSPVAGKFTTNFTSDAAGGTYGINLLGGASDFLVEDCSFQYFRTGVAAQSISGGATPSTSASAARWWPTARPPTTTRPATTSRPRGSTPTA